MVPPGRHDLGDEAHDSQSSEQVAFAQCQEEPKKSLCCRVVRELWNQLARTCPLQ